MKKNLHLTVLAIMVMACFVALFSQIHNKDQAVNERIDKMMERMDNLRQKAVELGIRIEYVERGVPPPEKKPPPRFSGEQGTAAGEIESVVVHDAMSSGPTPVERAIALAQDGKVDEAIDAWREVLAMVDETDHSAFDAYLSIAALEVERGQHSDAIHMYDEAIKLKPDAAGVYYNRGVMKNQIGRFKEAIEDFDEAIRFAPFLAAAYSNRGYSKASLERFRDAINDYDKAIELAPALSIAYKNRALANARLGREQEAIADFKRASRLDPSLRDIVEGHISE